MVKTALAVVEDAPTPPIFTDTIKIALYGGFGSRKTLQISYLIDLVGAENVLIVSAEHGLNTIRSKITVPENVIPVSTLDEARAAWAAAKEFAKPDRFVVVDGGSQITEWIANEQLSGAEKFYELTKKNQTIPVNLMGYGRYLQRGEINTMAIYGRVGRDSEMFLSAWIGLPCNLYFNYLEDMTGSSGFEKTVPYGPDVPGRVGLKAVMSSFDYVGRLKYSESGGLTAGFDPASGLYMARTREDRSIIEMPREIQNFELGKFVKFLHGEQSLEVTT